jgi:hypothetical protein
MKETYAFFLAIYLVPLHPPISLNWQAIPATQRKERLKEREDKLDGSKKHCFFRYVPFPVLLHEC